MMTWRELLSFRDTLLFSTESVDKSVSNLSKTSARVDKLSIFPKST